MTRGLAGRIGGIEVMRLSAGGMRQTATSNIEHRTQKAPPVPELRCSMFDVDVRCSPLPAASFDPAPTHSPTTTSTYTGRWSLATRAHGESNTAVACT